MDLEQASALVKQATKPNLEVMSYDPELSALRTAWEEMRYPHQRPPKNPWVRWPLRGKRRTGTTRAAVMEMGLLAQENANTRWFILTPHITWARDVLHALLSEAVTTANQRTMQVSPTRSMVTFANGSAIRAAALDDLYRLRGTRFDGGIIENPTEWRDVEFVRAALLKPNGKLIVTESVD